MTISNFLAKGARAHYRLITFIYKITHGCWNIFVPYYQHMSAAPLQNFCHKNERNLTYIAGVMVKTTQCYRDFWNLQPNSILFINDPKTSRKHLKLQIKTNEAILETDTIKKLSNFEV